MDDRQEGAPSSSADQAESDQPSEAPASEAPAQDSEDVSTRPPTAPIPTAEQQPGVLGQVDIERDDRFGIAASNSSSRIGERTKAARRRAG